MVAHVCDPDAPRVRGHPSRVVQLTEAGSLPAKAEADLAGRREGHDAVPARVDHIQQGLGGCRRRSRTGCEDAHLELRLAESAPTIGKSAPVGLEKRKLGVA
eukprot:scaffold5537_cov112-Isochrysis_galbana.AAC.5